MKEILKKNIEVQGKGKTKRNCYQITAFAKKQAGEYTVCSGSSLKMICLNTYTREEEISTINDLSLLESPP